MTKSAPTNGRGTLFWVLGCVYFFAKIVSASPVAVLMLSGSLPLMWVLARLSERWVRRRSRPWCWLLQRRRLVILWCWCSWASTMVGPFSVVGPLYDGRAGFFAGVYVDREGAGGVGGRWSVVGGDFR